MTRARAHAVTGNLTAAATELDALRTSAGDDAARDLACMMLMRVYLDQSAYMRAEKLLVEVYAARGSSGERSTRLYFALAGQLLNGARAHLERYRAFGLDLTDKSLPPEAIADIGGLRQLLEKLVEQARGVQIVGMKNMDGMALLEDAAKVRASLAHNDEDRTRWEGEFAAARRRLAASETRIASISQFPLGRSTAAAASSTAARSANHVVAASAPPPKNPAPAAVTLPPSSAQSTPPTTSTPASSTSAQGSEQRAPQTTAKSGSASTVSAQPPAAAARSQPGNAASDAKANNGLRSVGSLLDRVEQRITPSYPSTARAARTAGVVTVYMVVDERGMVEAIERSSGPELLRRAAEDAARRWKFRPTIVDGQPVRVAGFVSFNFAL